MKINRILLALLAVTVFWSCEKSENNVETETPENSLEKKNFRGNTIEVENLGDGTYLWGDIILSNDQLHQPGEEFDPFLSPEFNQDKLNLGTGVVKWPNNTIVYQIDNGIGSGVRSRLQEAFNEWTSKTAVRFKERTNESGYIVIRSTGTNCNCGSASLGVFSPGVINLGSNANKAVITHEIGHTLGYTHEQNRADRDQFITVLTENITSGGLSQYRIDATSTPLTDELDPNSIMMYRSNTFGNGNGPTMIINATGQPVPGFSDTLTALDIEGTNNAYPGDNPNPDGPCDGIAEWQSGVRYRIGDKVTYRGNLFERVFRGWRFLEPCK